MPGDATMPAAAYPRTAGGSLAARVLLGVALIILVIQLVSVIFFLNLSEAQLRSTARRRADTALAMLETLHAQTMLHRPGMADNDPVAATFDATLSRYSHGRADVSVWMAMSPRMIAWQTGRGVRAVEPPRDGTDLAAIATGREQEVFRGNSLRVARPVIMGQGVASAPRCLACHGRAAGIQPGDVLGVYSARTQLTSDRALSAREWPRQVLVLMALAVAAMTLLGLWLRRAVLRPLADLRRETERLARSELDQPVKIAASRDEIGAIGAALEQFRGWLVQKRALAQYNAFLATHDSLTGLPNRAAFAEAMKSLLARAATARAQRDETLYVVCAMIDLDRFKAVNDRHGHETGDALLRAVAGTIRDTLRPGETIARLGGDEFAAAMLADSEAAIAEFLARLESAIGTPFVSGGAMLSPLASIGYALSPDDGFRVEQLLSNADLAMYRAKAQPHQRIARYNRMTDEVSRARDAMLEDLVHALDRREIVVYYQAQNDTASGEVVGYEALARWIHPTRGYVSPTVFIPLAEECGLIDAIGEFVLREACRLAARQASTIRVAVNVSAVQLDNPGFAQLVQTVLIASGLSPLRLELELTETALVTRRDQALQAMRQLKALGVQIAIDDFGVGYSSLETINLFPIDKIKVDRSFVSTFDSEPKGRLLLKAIMTIGESLQVPVLAEGVETQSQLTFLRSLGCAQVQGYLFDEPKARDRLDGEDHARDRA